MAPYAEAGKKSLLFAGDVRFCDTGRIPVVKVKQSILPDLLSLHVTAAPMTIESDPLGTVYKNVDPTTDPVSIPKLAIFEIIEEHV